MSITTTQPTGDTPMAGRQADGEPPPPAVDRAAAAAVTTHTPTVPSDGG
jgi:hypothetical protein